MSCLLRFLLFDVFYGQYSRGVSVFTDVASCLSAFVVCCASVFRKAVLLLVDTPKVYMVILIHLLPRMNVSFFLRAFVVYVCVCASA